MALESRELLCIELGCGYLGKVYGGTWRIARDLDDENPSAASPEAEVTNGIATAAIEVKGLTVAELQQYDTYRLSLQRYLAPPCAGEFLLLPCSFFTLPQGKPIMRYLRKEIATVAPTLPPLGSGAILIPREGYLVSERPGPPGSIHCLHDYSDDLQAVAPRLDGGYFLIDGENGWAHNFVTDECRTAWHDCIVSACQTPTIEGKFQWNEEWELQRLDEGDLVEGHLEILVVSDVFTGDSANAAIWTMLEKGKAKFHQRWADHHVLVFDSRVPMLNRDRLASVAAEFDASDLGAVETILLVEGQDVSQIWPRP